MASKGSIEVTKAIGWEAGWTWGPEFMGGRVGDLPATITKTELRRAFGKPDDTPNGDGKIAFTWRIKFSDGTHASIYRYKDSKVWSIAGSHEAAAYVEDIVFEIAPAKMIEQIAKR